MIETTTSFWPHHWLDPSQKRSAKPRTDGLTMVIDKGLGFHSFCDLMEVASPYIDICKLGFGTPVLYSESLLRKKIKLAAECDLLIMPGGTFFEIALQTNTIEEYLTHIKELGFSAVEISDGTFPITSKQREEAISLACESGLVVCTEYGKKAASFIAEKEALLATVQCDIAAGASYVIMEARESGNVGIFNKLGEPDKEFVQEVIAGAGALAHRIIWEAPKKEQQVSLLHTIGLHANLGNIAPADALSVEALRRGLRADTSLFVFEGSS